MDSSTKHHSQRSYPNLPQLSIKPLTPNFPLSGSADDQTGTGDDHHQSTTPQSYIAPRSLPQTPSILSRSNSRARHRGANRSSAALNELALAPDALASGALTPRMSKGSHSRSHSSKSQSHAPDGTGWILQTASALTMSTAESKGQAWLATRTSSTSLVDAPATIGSRDTLYVADDEFSSVSHRHASRPSSRFGSRGNSRRSSRVGIMTPLGIKTPGDRDGPEMDYFQSVQPDFVDAFDEDEDAEVEDGEAKQIVWGHVGGWVDWAVGWMDFRNDEQDLMQLESMQEDANGSKAAEERPRRKIKWKQRRGREGADARGQLPVTRVIPPAPEDEGVVQDAAWLLGLAKNNLV